MAPPLAPLVILVLLLLAAAVADRVGATSMVNGHADNAPRRAVFMLTVMTPAFYVLFAILNAIDALVHRMTRTIPWVGTTVLILGVGFLCAKLLFRPEIDPPFALVPVVCASFVGAIVVVLPMSLWRRRIERTTDAEQPPA